MISAWADAPPPWAVMTPARRDHAARVVALLDTWAVAHAVDALERTRWRRAGWLHDALKDAPDDVLCAALDSEFRTTGPSVWHGPAAAARAATEGEPDAGVLAAVRYHTVGLASWDEVGRMLYLADYLEPGRRPDAARRAEWADRVAAGRDVQDVLTMVLRRRVARHDHRQLHPRTIEWLNALAP